MMHFGNGDKLNTASVNPCSRNGVCAFSCVQKMYDQIRCRNN